MPDLANMKPTERRIDLKSPHNDQFKIGVCVTMMSLDDDRLKVLRRSFQDEANKKAQRGKFVPAEQTDENLTRLIIAAMTGWDWGKDDNDEDAVFNGTKPEFKESKIREVFNTIGWFRDQLNEELGDTKAFFTI